MFIGINSFAQMVKVIDETTLQPIENVYIYNETQTATALTNAKGKAELDGFSNSQYLMFQHPSFKLLTISYKEAQSNNFLIKMVERSVLLDEIYVSASKREQDQTEIPQKITQINQEDIRLSNPQTSADLLQASGKVFVQKSQLGGGSPTIRGFAANSVMIAVDGIRMNNAIFRSGNLQNIISIDPNAVSSTEVIFGPGSIIYGSDALGGVMNFRTKDPELSFAENEVFVKSNALSRFSSANRERTFHADVNLGYEKWGFLSSVSYSNFDDLRSGGNFYNSFPDFGRREQFVVRQNGRDEIVANDDATLQKFSGYNQLNLMQKIRYKAGSALNLQYGFHYATTSDIPRYDRLIERENGDVGRLENAEWFYGPQVWLMNTLQIDATADSKWFEKVRGTFSYQWFEESRNDRKFQSATLRNREENVNVTTGSIDFDKTWGADKALYYGVTGFYNYVKSDAFSQNIDTGTRATVATRYPDGGSDYAQIAGYIKYQQDLSTQFTLVTGARYTHVFLNSRFNNTTFFNFPFDEITFDTGALSGSLGFTYRPHKDLQFNLNGSTGFRAPNVDDAAKVFDSEPGSVVVPNPNVKPEYAYNLDFAVIKRFDMGARIEINAFYTWLKDALVRRDFIFNGQRVITFDGQQSNVQAIINASNAYIYGASASLGLEFSNHIAFVSDITYTNGKDFTNNEPLRHVAPIFGKVALTYKAEQIKIETYSRFNVRKDISDFSPSERGKTHLYTDAGSPGWATLNIKTSYQFNETFQINAGVENILDKHYRPYSSGISAAGRNLILALRATL